MLPKRTPRDLPSRGRADPDRQVRRRAKTISLRRLTREEVAVAQEMKGVQYERPRTRAECKDGRRPCPFVACKYHLYLDVNPVTGSIKLNFPHLSVSEIRETCALDAADRGGITLEEIGEVMNLTRERIRQLEASGLAKVKSAVGPDRLREMLE